MSALREALTSYVTLRRGLGTKLVQVARQLEGFVAFLEREGVDVATSELAMRWAMEPRGVKANTWARRLSDVRRFLTYLHTIDPRTEVPDPALLRERRERRVPYLYSDQEIAGILHHASRLPSTRGLRGRTYATLFGLLTVTGLRIAEALALNRDDVNLQADLITVRHGKFGKGRFVPILPSTSRELARYACERNRIIHRAETPAFFLSDRGERVHAWAARSNFVIVSYAIGLRERTTRRHGTGPRLHDLRHRFAVTTLVRWYREGRDVERELPRLSTYLGHTSVSSTYWYLQAVPELLQLATDRAAERQAT